jgi:predicted dehydrogenase
MIHDLDLILSVVQSPVAEVRASGTPVLTDGIDIGNARIEFANGCVANLTASRVSVGTLRKMRLFLKDQYLAIDFGERRVNAARRSEDPQQPIALEDIPVPAGDALQNEIAAFARAVRQGGPAPVCGEDGRQALALALEIGALMHGGRKA